MKTASMVLGIVGGAIALLGALSMLLFVNPMLTSTTDIPGIGNMGDYMQNYMSSFGYSFNDLMQYYNVMGIPMLIGGVLAIIGGSIVKKKNTSGGVLMIIGCVLCGINLIILVAAILAFVRDKKAAMQYAPYQQQYPPQYQSPYPPQYPPQQQYGYVDPLKYQQPQNPAYPGQQPQPPAYPNPPKDDEQK